MGVPTVQPTGPSGNDYVHIDDTAYRGEGAFGGLQARALQQSGSDLEKAGNNLAGTADLIQGRYNQIAIDGAYNQLQDKYYDLTFGNPDAIFRLSGKDAMDKGPAVQQQITDARKEVYGGLQNDFQKLQFDDISRRLQANTLERVGTHITNQMHAWGVENSKAMIFNAARNAGADYNNDAAFEDGLTQAQMGAARATVNSGNANDPEVSAMNRSLAVNSVVQNRFDGLYSADPIKAGNWLLNGKTADGTPVRSLVSGPAGDQLIEKAQNAQDKGFVDGLFQKWMGGPSPGGGGGPVTPGSAGRIDDATAQRAQLVYDGLVKRGMDPVTAVGFAANAVGESAAKPGNIGDGGAAHGLFMWRNSGDDHRLDDFVTQRGHLPEEGTLDEQLDHVMWELNGRENPAYRKIQASDATPAARAAAISQFFERPQDVQLNASTRANYGNQLAARFGPGGAGDANATGPNAPVTIPPSGPSAPMGGAVVQPISTGAPDQSAPAPALAAMPDESAMVNDVLHAYPPGPRRDKLVADVRSQMSNLRLSIHTQADDFLHTLPDLQTSLLAGNSRPIPEDTIRHFLPPADAAREIENLHIAQTAGQEFRAVKWGSPQEVQAAGNRLLADLRMPGGTPIEDVPAPVVDENSDEAFRLRASILTKFQEQVKARRAALESDPMNYVAGNPLVSAKAAAIDPTNPQTLKDYWGTVLSVEGNLGVPPDKQHIMTRSTAEGEVGKLLNADPETNDAAAQMVEMQKDFGDVWPKAYHDLVSLGKLPDGYKTLAEIPAATVRWDYNQMLRLTKERGGVDKWQGDAGQSGGASNIRQINNSIDADPNLAALRSSLHVPGVFADDQNYTRIRDSVKNLAAYYSTFDGMSGPDALKKASDGIIGQKYDMDGTLRVAKGPNGENRLGVVESYGDTLLSGLKPEDLSSTQGRQPVAPVGNALPAADAALGLTPGEKFLYQYHLAHLAGEDGGVIHQPGGETSTLLQTSQEHDGRFYNVPTIWGGKTHSEDEAAEHAGAIGWDKWPAYPTRDAAEARYNLMHAYMERDITQSSGAQGARAALDAQRQAEMLAQARSTGRWVTNPMDDGAYLIGQDRNGVMYPVRRANGSIVAFKFGDAMSSGATDRGLTQTPYASPWLNPSSQMMR